MTLARFNLLQQLQAQHDKGLTRTLLSLKKGVTPYVWQHNKAYLNFASNDYLGLAQHPQLMDAAQHYLKIYGVGAGASHLVTGHFDIHDALAQRLAEHTGYAEALLFSNGYMANLAVQSSLMGRHDTIFQDKLNHASLIDGAHLSGAQLKRYKHNDMAHLAQLLTQHNDLLAQKNNQKQMIVTDQIFSMDGDEAPINELKQLSETYQAALMIDDAHGFGWRVNPLPKVDIYMATLGKAIGSYGAFVAGSAELIEYLKQFSRPFIYTTALPPMLAAASLAALDVINDTPQLLTTLQQNIHYLQNELKSQGWNMLASNSPIQPIILGDSTLTLKVAQLLKQHGIIVGAIRPPTVPHQTARLRITLSAAHTPEHIDQLCNALKAIRQLKLFTN